MSLVQLNLMKVQIWIQLITVMTVYQLIHFFPLQGGVLGLSAEGDHQADASWVPGSLLTLELNFKVLFRVHVLARVHQLVRDDAKLTTRLVQVLRRVTFLFMFLSER